VAIGVALVVVLAAAVGVFVFADSSDSDDDAVLATLDSDVTVSTLTVSHSGGDTLDPENVRVVLEGNTTIHDSSLAAFSDPASSNETVDAGDTWQQTLTRFISEAQLRVIHEPTNTILHEQTHSVTLPEDSLTLSIDGATNSTELPGDATAASDSDVRVPYTVRGTFDGGETVDVTDSATLAFASDSLLSTTGNGTIQAQDPVGNSQTVTVTANFQNRVSNAVAVTVRDGVNYTVAIDNSTATNNSVTFSYTVTNEGIITGQQDITITVAGRGLIETIPAVQLATGESYIGNSTVPVNESGLTVTVNTDDDTATEPFAFGRIVYANNDRFVDNIYIRSLNDWSLKNKIDRPSINILDASSDTHRFGSVQAGYTSGNLFIHKPDTQELTQNINVKSPLVSLDWSPDESHIATGTRPGYDPVRPGNVYANPALTGPPGVYIYNTDDWERTQVLGEIGNYTRVSSVAWSPDGSHIAYAANETVYIHGTGDWQLERTLTEAGDMVSSVAWSPDGTSLAYGANDTTTYIHDTDTWQPVQTLTGATTNVTSVAWSQDGTYLASGATNVSVYNTSDWTTTATLTEVNTSVTTLAWAPADAYLTYSSSTDVYVHETDKWSLSRFFTDANSDIHSIVFLPR